MLETRLPAAPAPGRTEVVITYPTGRPSGGAVLCPPHPLLGGDLENNVLAAHARSLPARGLVALRFNYRGAGRREGTPDGKRFEYWKRVEETGDYRDAIDDARAAHRLARTIFDPVALVGYSFGAIVAARLAIEDGIPDPLALLCPPFRRLDLDALARRDGPLLLVLAGADGLAEAPPLAELRARLPRARIETLEGHDHFFIGAEAEVASRVLAFLGETTGTGRPDGGTSR